MSYSSQKFVNYFPSWSKSRKDPSSQSYRLLSVFEEAAADQGAEAVKTSSMFKLMSEECSFGEMTEIFLQDEDRIKTAMQGTSKSYIYPKVKGISNTNEIMLERALNISEFLYSAPTRVEEKDTVSVIDWLIWSDSSPDIYSQIDTGERLLIEVKNSSIYYRKDSLLEEDRKAGYLAFVCILGKDQDYKDVIETVPVQDDGCILTRNIFKEVTSVTKDGFDGEVNVYLTSSKEGLLDETFLKSKHYSGVTTNSSGPLRYYLSSDSGFTYLLPVINKKFLGRNSLRPENEIVEEDLELLCNHLLLDKELNPVSVKSITVSPLDLHLYALEESGRVLVYKPGFTPFKKQDSLPSEDTYMDIQLDTHRVEYNEVAKIWTWFRIPTVRVAEVTIKRVSPSGIVEYLQSSLLWGPTLYKFPGKDATNKQPQESWSDFSFEVNFNEIGQWDFYCTASLPALKDKEFTSVTSVMVEHLIPVREHVAEAGEEIFFDKENLLCIKQGNSYKRFQEYRDLYIADPTSQRIILKEIYDEVEAYHE